MGLDRGITLWIGPDREELDMLRRDGQSLVDEWPAITRHCTPVSRSLLPANARVSTSSVLENGAGEKSA